MQIVTPFISYNTLVQQAEGLALELAGGSAQQAANPAWGLLAITFACSTVNAEDMVTNELFCYSGAAVFTAQGPEELGLEPYVAVSTLHGEGSAITVYHAVTREVVGSIDYTTYTGAIMPPALAQLLASSYWVPLSSLSSVGGPYVPVE